MRTINTNLNSSSTDTIDVEKPDERRLIGQGVKALERLSDFLEKEPDMDEEKLKEDCGDIIVTISGMEWIYSNQYYQELPQRATPLTFPAKVAKKPKTKLVDSERKGLLVSNIDKKEKMVKKLKTKMASLNKDLERTSDYVEKKRVMIMLQKTEKSLAKAEVELQDWKNRLDLLVDGNNEHPEAGS
ncbi:hypothetical protein ACFL7D_04775 [candidate division KSB1 bacterium]